MNTERVCTAAALSPRSNGIRSSETDEELAARFERDAMALLDPLYAGALRMTLDRKDADALLEETMLKGFAAFDSFPRGTNLKAWLFQIMTSTWTGSDHRAQGQVADCLRHRPTDWSIADIYRHSSSEFGAAGAEVSAAPLPDEEVVEALMALSEGFRMVLHFAYVEGFRYQEIAEILHTSVGTVTCRLSSARAQFRTLLADVAMTERYANHHEPLRG